MPDYLLVNDVHLSDRPPSSCTDTYLADLFDLLRGVGDIAAQRSANAVIFAGDFYHHKTPGRTSHATVRATIDVLRDYPCPSYVVPGNHDMQHDRLDSIDTTQPLGVVIASGALRLLNGWMKSSHDLDGLDLIYGVPWLWRFDDQSVGDALEDWRHCDPEDAHGLVVTHAPLYPPGQELKYEYYHAAKWADAMDNWGTVHYGHVHEPHGIYVVDGVTFSNPGALSRGSLHEHNLIREIKIAVWNSDTGDIDHVVVPHKPAEEVFRLVQADEVKTAQLELDEFLASIGQTRIEITSVEAVMDHIRSLALGPELEKLVENLLTEACP